MSAESRTRPPAALSYRGGTFVRGDDVDRRLRVARCLQEMLEDGFTAGMTVFARIEMGDESFHISLTDTPDRLPRGAQVLIQ